MNVAAPSLAVAESAGAAPLAEAERLARLRLARSENVGPRTYAHLMRRFGDARRALEALPSLAAAGGRAGYVPCPETEALAEFEAGGEAGARLVILGEDAYPPLLAAIDHPPPVLWVSGDPAIFRRPAVAIVGARNASALGLRTARNLARGLGTAGHVVVSGLARGIDAAAHEAALATGTVAVMAGGLDRVYPPENAALARHIAAEGALVSECPMGIEPTSRHFPRRNRLVSGLGHGVLVIEAAVRSGSLITARCALEQGREAMACPGGPEDPRAGGSNQLIREGAALIRNVDDVLEALAAPRTLELAEPGRAFLFDEGFFDTDGEPGLETVGLRISRTARRRWRATPRWPSRSCVSSARIPWISTSWRGSAARGRRKFRWRCSNSTLRGASSFFRAARSHAPIRPDGLFLRSSPALRPFRLLTGVGLAPIFRPRRNGVG